MSSKRFYVVTFPVLRRREKQMSAARKPPVRNDPSFNSLGQEVAASNALRFVQSFIDFGKRPSRDAVGRTSVGDRLETVPIAIPIPIPAVLEVEPVVPIAVSVSGFILSEHTPVARSKISLDVFLIFREGWRIGRCP